MPALLARRRPEIGGVVLLLGVLAFLAIERLAEASYPGFDRTSDPMSQLGELGAPTKPLWDAGLAILAGSWFAGAAAFVWPWRSRSLDVLNALPAVGLAVAVVVPLNVNLAIHEVAAFSAFLTGILAVLANARHLRSPWREASFGLGLLALVGLSPASELLIRAWGWGILERLVVLPLLAALTLFGCAALARAHRAPEVMSRARLRPVGLAIAVVLVAALGLGSGLTHTGYRDVFGPAASGPK